MDTNLYNIELFNSESQKLKQELYQISKIVSYPKGSNPFFPEDLLKYFYIVIEGKIKTYQINFDTNKEQTIFIYRKGDMFDVISLLDDKPHEVSYEILQDCKVLQIPIENVRNWLINSPSFNRKFFPYLAQIIRHIENLSVEISLYDTKDRLINLLLDNVNPNNHFRYQLLQNLSNSEIAKLLGTVRHVIERTLKQLKEDNIIKKSRKNITILNFEKLLQKTSQMLLK